MNFTFLTSIILDDPFVYCDSVFLLVPVRELDVPGDIYERKTYPFEFPTVEMPYDTYNGVNVRLRYYII